jgi:hypothetical protein
MSAGSFGNAAELFILMIDVAKLEVNAPSGSAGGRSVQEVLHLDHINDCQQKEYRRQDERCGGQPGIGPTHNGVRTGSKTKQGSGSEDRAAGDQDRDRGAAVED